MPQSLVFFAQKWQALGVPKADECIGPDTLSVEEPSESLFKFL
jgi:hypothetical protein